MKEGLTYSAPYRLGDFGLGNVVFQQVLALYENGLLEKCYCASNGCTIIPTRYIKEVGHFNGQRPDIQSDKMMSTRLIDRKTPKNFLGWSSGYQQKALRKSRGDRVALFKFSGSHHPIIQNAILERESVIQAYNFGVSNQIDYTSLDYGISEMCDLDHVMGCSKQVKDSYLRVGYPEDKISYLYLGVDTDYFYPEHIPDETFRVLFLGFNWFRKGFMYAATMFANLKPGEGKVHFTAKTNVQLQMANTTFIPGIEDTIKPLYDKADLLFLPTIEEGCVQVVLEAMACGVPCLTTKAAGSSELIQNGIDGYVYSDAASCSEALQLVYDNREKLPYMGKLAHESMKGNNWKDYRKQFAKWVESRLI